MYSEVNADYFNRIATNPPRCPINVFVVERYEVAEGDKPLRATDDHGGKEFVPAGTWYYVSGLHTPYHLSQIKYRRFASLDEARADIFALAGTEKYRLMADHQLEAETSATVGGKYVPPGYIWACAWRDTVYMYDAADPETDWTARKYVPLTENELMRLRDRATDAEGAAQRARRGIPSAALVEEAGHVFHWAGAGYYSWLQEGQDSHGHPYCVGYYCGQNAQDAEYGTPTYITAEARAVWSAERNWGIDANNLDDRFETWWAAYKEIGRLRFYPDDIKSIESGEFDTLNAKLRQAMIETAMIETDYSQFPFEPRLTVKGEVWLAKVKSLMIMEQVG